MANNDQLLPRAQFLALKLNNFVFRPEEFETQFPVLVEILKGHRIFRTLNISRYVPEIYLQQLWNTISNNTAVRPSQFEGRIDNEHIMFTLDQFRTILRLPSQIDFPGKEDYDKFTTDAELCADIQRLGYFGAAFSRVTGFIDGILHSYGAQLSPFSTGASRLRRPT